DLATFEKAFREGRLVKPETRDLMQTAQRTTKGRKTGYGLGWMVREVNGVPTVSHGGNTGAFSNSLFTVPSEKLTIVLTMNVHNQSGDGLAQRIAEHYAPALAPIAYKESPDPDPARTEKLLKSVKALAAGELASADRDPDYLGRLQTARGRMGLGALARFRSVESMAFLNQEKADPDTLLRYRTKVDGKSVLLTLVVTSEGRLFQVGFRDEG
ncbi:MAG: beta-lactamase family protein, partial [Nitrospirae bacterium]|nr:beta-lactamase family protein [Fimbriimonadaceae bacterium]